jgi:hypothetical protein
MSNQEPLQEGDTVEVVNDNRTFLNGRQGVVFSVVGPRIYVEFENVAPLERRAVILLVNLKKVEGGR